MELNNEALHVLQQVIDDLQSRLAHQEDLLQSLNDVVAHQDKRMQQLEKQLQQQQNKLEDMVFHVEYGANEKPPHY